MLNLQRRILIASTILVSSLLLSACVVNDPYDDGFASAEERLEQDVHQSLALHDSIDGTDIQIEVEGDDVWLTGFVDSHEEAALVHDVVHGVDGVDDVDVDDLQVR